MSFLDRLLNNRPNSGAGNGTPDPTLIGIRANAGETIFLNPADYEGKTIQQVFTERASDLGIEPSQVNRYLNAGTLVQPTDTPTPGAVYQAATQTMEKGRS
jgi:hypothetical protein